MSSFYVFGSLTNSLPIAFIDSPMRENFSRMANYCGVNPKLPVGFPSPPSPVGMTPASYSMLQMELSILDDAYYKHDFNRLNEIIQNLHSISIKKGYWMYNEFYLPPNYILPDYSTGNLIKKQTTGVVNDPINNGLID